MREEKIQPEMPLKNVLRNWKMPNRKKRLEKQKQGLLKQAEKHKLKAKTEKGRKDTTQGYWIGEIERFERRAEQRDAILKKIRKKK